MTAFVAKRLVVLGILIVVSGCGGGSDKPEAVVKKFLGDVAAKNYKDACALLSPDGHSEVEIGSLVDSLFEKTNPTCEQGLRSINADNVAQKTLDDFGFTHTDSRQNYAVVRAKHGDWFLEKVQGKWRIASVETLAAS